MKKIDYSSLKKYITVTILKNYSHGELSYDFAEADIDLDINSIQYITGYILDMIKKQGIVFFDKNAVNEIFTGLKNGRLFCENKRIADEIPPVPGKKAWIEWLTDPKAKNKSMLHTTDDRVDLKDFTSGFYPVYDDQLLCVKHNATAGKPGKKINGEEIPAKEGKDINLIAKNGIVTDEYETNTIYKAKVDGVIVVEDNSVSVEETLTINGDVDYNTGNIHYTKDIVIKGNVKSGFTVETKGNIFIEGYVEAGGQVSAEGNIEIKLGVIGKETKISAHKKISASFVHLATLHSEDQIEIEKFVLDAEIFAENFLEVHGKKLKTGKSAVIGSQLSSDGYIRINSVGAPLASRTIIRMCDIAGRVQNEFRIVKEYEKKLTQVVRTMKVNFKSPLFIKALQNMNEVRKKAYIKLLKYIQHLIDQIRINKKKIELIKLELSSKLDKARLVINENIVPPLTIIFNEKMLRIRGKRFGQTFIFNKTQRLIDILNNS